MDIEGNVFSVNLRVRVTSAGTYLAVLGLIKESCVACYYPAPELVIVLKCYSALQCTMCILSSTMALWSKAEIQKYTF